MIIDIFAAGVATGSKETLCGGCAVIMVAASGSRAYRREMSFKLGRATLNLSQLKSAIVGLLSVNVNPDKVTLHTNSQYVTNMLTRTAAGWATKPQSNTPEVAALRDAFDSMGDAAVVSDRFDGGIGAECLVLAKRVITGHPIDTGTLEADGDPIRLERKAYTRKA